MSKRDYFLQKGLQMQRLDEQISAAPQAGGKEVAKYRELCPPGTPDTQIQVLIGQCKGDAQRMENAISDLWEDYRGNGQDDAWATVAKKSAKKKQDHAYSRSYSSHKTQHQQDDHAEAPQDGDAQPPRSSERFSTRGRGSMRGRGMVSSRGGRGGRGGRGRGGAVVATGSSRGTRAGDNEEESPENDNNSTDGSSPSNEARVQQSSKTAKDSKRDRGAKTTTTTTTTKTTTTQPAAQTPPVVYPVLTGAWTKKLNVTGVTSKPKPVEPVPTPAPAPAAPAAAPKPAEKPTEPAVEKEAAAVTPAAEAPKAASPKKKTQHEKKSKKAQKSTTTDAVEETAAVVEKTETVKAVEKVASPKASPKKTVEKKKKTKTSETTPETSTSKIAAGWGNLDVSTSTMDEWSASASAAATEPKKASTPNAWARGSPVLSPPASKEPTPAPKSPIADARPTVVPGSPKDIDVPRSTGSASTSPRPYLKMGKWDTAATPNLSLQFGSFSLNGMDSLEPSSPRGWASTTTTTTTSSSNNGGKTVTKTTTTQSAWGTTTKTASPKKTVSPDRAEQQRAQETTATKATTSAPPGLSVDSGRVTPTTGQSPRFTPSAPSPASLPKPDEVKRGTPTRAQGGPFQAQGGAAAQNNKMNIGGYGTGLYQASYGQYSMDLGRPAASTPGQLPTGSGTPKSAGARGGAAGQVAAQSPSRGQQPVAQMQQIPLQQQTQQQQQQVQQQTQQKQAQQQQAQQPQQNQQNQAQQQTAAQMHQQGPAGMQQGYHYAPPPPPGMALPYNPYNYGYYQGYGYYQNPQFAQYSPRTQYPPRGSMPYGVEGPVPGFSNPPNMPYQDQHMMAQQHEYAAGVPQGFGEINAGYLQQAPMQQGGHHGHHGHQNGPQSHGKGGAASGAGGAGSQQSHVQRSNAGMQGYQNAGGRDHVSPPVPNASAAMTGSYGQHYGWAGNYGAQPVGGWGHMMPQGYQQSPSQQQQVPPQQQQQQQQQQPNAHQQSYRQYGNGGAQGGNNANDVNQAHWNSS